MMFKLSQGSSVSRGRIFPYIPRGGMQSEAARMREGRVKRSETTADTTRYYRYSVLRTTQCSSLQIGAPIQSNCRGLPSKRLEILACTNF